MTFLLEVGPEGVAKSLIILDERSAFDPGGREDLSGPRTVKIVTDFYFKGMVSMGYLWRR